jgi:ribosomal protein S18 acetylase RimI-like enzyme
VPFSFWPIEKHRDDVKVKSVFCFVIAPEMQRKGVATRLLQRVCKDAPDEGFDYVEAYVNKTHTELDFRGPLEMYKNCGFYVCAEQGDRAVVRKELKTDKGPRTDMAAG